MSGKEKITIKATVDVNVKKVWEYWTEPECIKRWNTASEDWHTTIAENDLRVGGKFLSRMEAKDGSFGFDFGGIYDEVILHKLISYTLGDERKVRIIFEENGNKTEITEIFEAESENSVELQKNGWQSILDNFKKYSEEAAK
ncbi:SRPBCC family protein [Clostridium saccharoperbutylacetonicum]|uniref:SRPBCC family protein n=1 Tax=Clostridium saccharoperbutylacetonicum TaxID=36745 RepID=UPI0039ED4616